VITAIRPLYSIVTASDILPLFVFKYFIIGKIKIENDYAKNEVRKQVSTTLQKVESVNKEARLWGKLISSSSRI
jgi:hypothetical protein